MREVAIKDGSGVGTFLEIPGGGALLLSPPFSEGDSGVWGECSI